MATPAHPLPQEESPQGAEEGPRGKIIVVTSPRGGAGKTTVSLLLAHRLAARPLSSSPEAVRYPRVLLWDASFRSGMLEEDFFTRRALGGSFPIIPDYTFFPSLQGIPLSSLLLGSSLALSLVATTQRRLPAAWGRRGIPPEEEGEVRRLLREAREAFDYVVVDTEPGNPPFRKHPFLQEASSIILPMLPSNRCLQEALEWRDCALAGTVTSLGEDLTSLRGTAASIFVLANQLASSQDLIIWRELAKHERLLKLPAAPHAEVLPWDLFRGNGEEKALLFTAAEEVAALLR